MAGQSNAVGVAPASASVEASEAPVSQNDDKIFQLSRSCYGHADKSILPALEPLDFQGCDLKILADGTVAIDPNRPWAHQNTRSSVLAFARRYIASGKLKEGRKILIIPAAKSGSAITLWTTDSTSSALNYFNDMHSRLQELFTDRSNRLIAFHWQQGEADMLRYYDDVTLASDASHSPAAYKAVLTSIVQKIQLLPSGDHAAILIGEAAKELPYGGLREHIAKMIEVANETSCGAFIGSDDLLVSSGDVSAKDQTHFSPKGQIEMAQRRLAKFTALPVACQGASVAVPATGVRSLH